MREYFTTKAHDGIYHAKSQVTTAMMVWDMRNWAGNEKSR